MFRVQAARYVSTNSSTVRGTHISPLAGPRLHDQTGNPREPPHVGRNHREPVRQARGRKPQIVRTDETAFSHQPGPELRACACYGQIYRKQRETLQRSLHERRARTLASVAQCTPWSSSLAVMTDKKNASCSRPARCGSRLMRPRSCSIKMLASIRTPKDPERRSRRAWISQR